MTQSHDTPTPALSVESEYVLVPREPTDRMLNAADGWTDLIDAAGGNTAESRKAEFRTAWSAMLRAAPAPNPSPAAKGGDAEAVGKAIREWAEGPCDSIEDLITATVAAVTADIELSEIRDMLLDGQGDDDGLQILPEFKEGQSAAQMVSVCLSLLEKRRDMVEGLSAVTPSPQPADAVRPVDETDIAGWGVFMGHAIPTKVARFIAAQIGERSKAALSTPTERPASDPAPAGEAAEPDDLTAAYMAGVERGREDTARLREEERCPHCDGTGDVHRADGEWLGECDCAEGRLSRLREELERVTRQCEFYRNSLTHEIANRDEAVKALETAAEDERDRLFAKIMEKGSFMRPEHDQGIRQFLQSERATMPADRAAARSASSQRGE